MLKYTLIILLLALTTESSAQNWRFPDCRDLTVENINFSGDSVVHITVYNDCDSCTQHVYTGIEVYNENEVLLGVSRYPDTETSPENKSKQSYEVVMKSQFIQEDISRIVMTAQLCDSMEVDLTVLSGPSFLNTDQLSLFPNPSQEIVQLIHPKNIQIRKVILTNLNGQIVGEVKIENQAFNIGHLPRGIYFVIVLLDKSRVVRRLVVE